MKPYIYPYNMKSKSAKALAQALGTKRIKPNGNFVHKSNRCVVNWGSSSISESILNEFNHYLNHPDFVWVASNKKASLEELKFEGINVPLFTENKGFIEDAGGLWVARTLLNSSGGKGIILFDPEKDDIPTAKLYVKYIKKKDEYRVHVFKGNVIDIQQKRKRKENSDVDYQVRNYSNGWVFCRENVEPPQEVISLANDAVYALGLDFGAVDVIWNEHYQKAYVLEVNTAPGLEGQTLISYVNAIKEYCNAAD